MTYKNILQKFYEKPRTTISLAQDQRGVNLYPINLAPLLKFSLAHFGAQFL